MHRRNSNPNPLTAGAFALAALLFACTRAEIPPAQIVAVAPATQPISTDRAGVDDTTWKIETPAPEVVRLFEVSGDLCDDCRLSYRAQVKTQDAQGHVYLEMWVRVPGQGEFFSKGLDRMLTGTTDWTPLEIPFFLQAGEKPDLVRLNLTFKDGGGTAWIRDVSLWKGPLP